MPRAHRGIVGVVVLLGGCFETHPPDDGSPPSDTNPSDTPASEVSCTSGDELCCDTDDCPCDCADTPPDLPPGDPGPEDPGCVPGGERWCGGLMFDSWGRQTCEADGTWSACEEEDGDRPDTACACRRFYFDPECCETPDCLVPADHAVTVCESDGGLCAYCTSDDDCSGEGICLEDGHGGTLCGVACTGEGQGDCPDGFTCASIRDYYGDVVALQCVPVDPGTCDGG